MNAVAYMFRLAPLPRSATATSSSRSAFFSHCPLSILQASLNNLWHLGSSVTATIRPGVSLTLGSLVRLSREEFVLYHSSSKIDLSNISADSITLGAELCLEH
jgi:hypothetical protein